MKEAEKVKFEGLYHIYDYALKLLLGNDYQPLYDPNNPHDVLDKRFNTLKMSGAPGVFNMILNTSPLDAASFVGHTNELNSLVLYWLVEGDMYETMLAKIMDSPKKLSFLKSMKDIERRMIQDSITHGIKDAAFWQELVSSPIPLLLLSKEELEDVLKPCLPTTEEKGQGTVLDGFVLHISTLFLSEDIVQNQEDALALYRFITKNKHDTYATIATIYQFQKQRKMCESKFKIIYTALKADISAIKAYNTLSPIYNCFETLKRITSREQIDYKFKKEEKAQALTIYNHMITFASTFLSDKDHHAVIDETQSS